MAGEGCDAFPAAASGLRTRRLQPGQLGRRGCPHLKETFMDNSEVVDVLNDLIETSKDGEYGFTTCAERATAVELKQTFLRRASDCARAAGELQALVVEYGGKAEDSGTVAGAVHRGWVS